MVGQDRKESTALTSPSRTRNRVGELSGTDAMKGSSRRGVSAAGTTECPPDTAEPLDSGAGKSLRHGSCDEEAPFIKRWDDVLARHYYVNEATKTAVLAPPPQFAPVQKWAREGRRRGWQWT